MNRAIRVSRQQYEAGDFQADPGFVAIRITDTVGEFADVTHPGCHAEHRFHFEDVEAQGQPGWEGRLSAEQAAAIVAVLRDAHDQMRDVVVHCNSGIYRSGAVCFFAGSRGGFRYLNADPHGRRNFFVSSLLYSAWQFA